MTKKKKTAPAEVKQSRPLVCSCGSPGNKDQECPYAAEIYGKVKVCNCCDGCVNECAMDI